MVHVENERSFDTALRGMAYPLTIDATHLKAHRTAASLLKKGMFPVVSGEPKVD
ncbi:hypothetical protein BLJAPNOD_04107 [Ensifer sp. M14]|nr:hypothetical protein BLJAPNOD_04107 [Ensifer sp. M14]